MTNLTEDSQFNDRIAEFTDMVLSRNKDIDMNDSYQQDEFAKLQKTILQMKKAVQLAQPDASTSARIRKNLLIARNKSNYPIQNSKATNQKRVRFFAIASSFVLLLLIGVLILPMGSSDVPLMGAADGISPLEGIILVAGIILIAIIIWLNRQR